MRTVKLVGVMLLAMAVSALAEKPIAQKVKTKSGIEKVAIQKTALLACSVSGQVKLDPNDHTYGHLHYKGNVTFKANKALEGVNLYLSGPKYACTCVTCPKGSSHATGLKPEGKFDAGQSKSYMADCSSDSNNPLSGPVGTGKIQFFKRTQPEGEGGVFEWANCGGKFNYTD